MGAEDERRPAAQAPKALRQQERRRNNHLEQGGRVTVNDEFDEADMETTESNADYGIDLRVTGFERITLFLDHTAGTATTGVNVRAQASYVEAKDGRGIPDAEWYDIVADEADDGNLEDKVWEIAITATGRRAWTVPTVGNTMRFKVWADGGTPANSRATLYAARHMDAS